MKGRTSMVELLHNPNSNKSKIIPRKSAPQPQKEISISSLNESNKTKSKQIDGVTFDTTLRIDNHLKNFMKAMVILGYSSTQQNGLAQLQKTFFESLTESEQNTLTTQIQTLETGDANKVKSK
ncbi:conserved hypothetical protein (plasmid) [Levilactobacillus brevis KB290]|nr:conserved hypothetical protein [Levilactobacillus brevis KB290]